MVESHICRLCGVEFKKDEGYIKLLLCEECAYDYDIDAIEEDISSGTIPNSELTNFDLEVYLYEDDEYYDDDF